MLLKMQASKKKKVALITGSGSGIGANMALDLVNEGYQVIVTGRTMEKLQSVVNRCKHDQVLAFVADLFDMRQVDALMDFVKTNFNRLDVLVNNACFRGDIKNVLDDRSHVELAKVLHLNLSVPLYLIQKCLTQLEGGLATILNISSIASSRAVPLHLYSISKACFSELSKQLSKDLDIPVVTVSPGPILTEERPHHQDMAHQTMINRVGTTQEISNLAIFAIQNAQLFNGQELFADGGCLAKGIR